MDDEQVYGENPKNGKPEGKAAGATDGQEKLKERPRN